MNNPPKAKKSPYTQTFYDHIHEDDYAWMRDPKWPKTENKEILQYLEEENKYAASFFAPHETLINQIYEELVGRIKLADRSVPIKKRSYYYFNVTKEDSSYSIHMRRDAEGREEIILDENLEAAHSKYFSIGTIAINNTGRLMAYSVDNTGNEHFTVFVKDLFSQSLLPDHLENVLGSIVWSEDSSGFYYTKVDDQWRQNELYYHTLGSKQSEDTLVYKESDNTFRISVDKTSDYKYILVDVSSSDSNEIMYIRSDDINHTLSMLTPRKSDHLCSADHFHNHFYICTNDRGKNFRLVRLKSDSNSNGEHSEEHSNLMRSRESEEIIAHSEESYLIGFSLYDSHIVIETKEEGLPRMRILSYTLADEGLINFPDPTYSASVVYSSCDDDGVIIHYSSMVSPTTIFKYEFSSKLLRTLKVLEIPSGYDPHEYKSERLYIPSREVGIKIPISIVYKKSSFKKDGSNPLFLYGYGSYGLSIPPRFSSNIISLLDRGFVYAIAHIRGGDDLGFKWYEAAKFLNKKKTFEDFIDAAQALVVQKYTGAGQISIFGGSAGGMLVGNVINQEPQLFKAAIADVPFVDVLNTMLDESLPLTPGEYKEWGNPKQSEYYNYIKSYSPYDNVQKQAYPHLYVLAGLNDPRVAYWEPTKWVAKLRDLKTNQNTLILETEMDTGHGGKSGRFDKFKEVAKKYAFILITSV